MTFHRSINYGAFMQSYALSHEIQKRYGDVVEIIDFEKKSKHEHYKPKFSIKSFLTSGFENQTRYKRFQEDLSLLPLSDDTLITDNYEEVFDFINNKYDIIIVGSDAVWAYNKGLGLENPYWLFGDKLKCIKMSYAASAYSLDVKNVSQKDKDYIASCLKSFSYIGVRDQETYNFVKSTDSNFEVYRNCDPTVLLDYPDKKNGEKVLKKNGVDTNKKIVSIMLGDNRYINKIQEHLGGEYEFINIYVRNSAKDRYKFWLPNKFIYNLSPFEWYNIFSCVYLNFTSYFHGTLLALKGNVPTISFDNTSFNYEYMSKIRQILTDIGMGDCWYVNKTYSVETEKKILSLVDSLVDNHELVCQNINEKMFLERKKSESFFEKLDLFFK